MGSKLVATRSEADLTSTCHETLFIVWARGTPTKGMVPILAPHQNADRTISTAS